jgi:hypothetical protein
MITLQHRLSGDEARSAAAARSKGHVQHPWSLALKTHTPFSAALTDVTKSSLGMLACPGGAAPRGLRRWWGLWHSALAGVIRDQRLQVQCWGRSRIRRGRLATSKTANSSHGGR